MSSMRLRTSCKTVYHILGACDVEASGFLGVRVLGLGFRVSSCRIQGRGSRIFELGARGFRIEDV